MAKLTNRQKQRRILVLADFLEKVPPHKFQFESWFAVDGNCVYQEDLTPTKVKSVKEAVLDKSCGTTACAAGWAAVRYPQWKLSVRRLGVDDQHLGSVFGLSADQAFELFYPGGEEDRYDEDGYVIEPEPVRPKEWAKRARKFYAELKGAC